MSDTSRAVLLGFFAFAACVWVGGYVAIVVVARTATRILAPAQRIAFFRSLGQAYLRVGVPALVVALGTGAGLLSNHRWDGLVTATLVVAGALVVALVVGVLQARYMTRLRSAALASPLEETSARVRRAARSAALLRGVIGLFSLTLIALGAVLAP